MDKKVIGKINSGPLAIMLLTAIAHVAIDLKITLKDKISGQKVMEIDGNAEKDAVKKFTDCLTGDESYRYSVEFEAIVPLMYLNEEFLKIFNIPNCCEIKIL
jgi:23S rRNA maturation mini-RNase III